MAYSFNLSDYEEMALSSERSYRMAADLLGLPADDDIFRLCDAVDACVHQRRDWSSDNREYEYGGYDSGDCYAGGSLKEAVCCGDYAVMLISGPGYASVRILRKKSVS